jgi:predicted small secreted protein
MKSILISATVLIAAASLASAETKSGLTESVAIGGKTIGIKYSAPAVNGRVGKLFGKDGTIGSDQNYPVWRGGANAATAFHTDADLDLGGLAVPKGDYTLFINLANPASWELIVNKQTGQSGLEYDAKQDFGRVKMTVSKPTAMVEQLKYTLSNAGGNKGKLQLAWENVVASVNFTVK